MKVRTYLEYPEEKVATRDETGQVIRLLLLTAKWLQPTTYGSGEPDQPVPKLRGEELAEYLADFCHTEGWLTVEEKRGLQLIVAPPQPNRGGRVVWIAPHAHKGLERSAHMATVWQLMHLTGGHVAEAMSQEEESAFTYRLIDRGNHEERVRTVRGDRWGLRHAFWRMWFGADWVNFFGRGRLDAAPAFFKQPLAPDGYFVELYAKPEDWDEPDNVAASQAFEKSLGRQSFYDPKSPDRKLETPFE